MIKAKISPLNGIRFVPADIVPASRYNSPEFDKEWFYESIKSWQTKVRYAQKVQHTDPLRLQIWTNADSTKQLQLYNCSGALVNSTVFLLNNYAPSITEGATTYGVYEINLTGFWDGILTSDGEGVYYARIVTENADGDKLYFISEPIYLKSEHDNTVFVEYGNTYNKDSIIFEQTNAIFGMRIEGAVTEFSPITNRTVFEDQGYNPIQLSGTATRQWKLDFGGDGIAIPIYLVDKLNHIFACDLLKVDGKRYSQLADSNLELDIDDFYPLTSASISLGEPDNEGDFEYSAGEIQVLPSMAYPYCLYSMTMGSVGFPDFVLQYPLEFTSTNNTQVLAELNGMVLNQGLKGAFSIAGTELYYTLGSNEYFDTVEKLVLTDPMNVLNTRVQSPGSGDSTISFTLTSTNPISKSNVPFACFGGDPNLVTKLKFGHIPGTTITFPVTNAFVTGDEVTTRVYATTDINLIWIDGARVKSITGYPALLRQLVIVNSDEMTAFTIHPDMNAYKDTFVSLSIVNCSHLTDFGVLSPNAVYAPGICNKLKTMYCWNGTALTPANVDKFLNSVFFAVGYNGYATPGCDIKLSGQSPAAPPTSASLTARTYIINSGGSLLTD